MNTETIIELFGYLGSVMVVVSMLMSSVVRLRILNTIGSVISGAYALIIGSFPLALMNLCLVAINAYNLRKLLVIRQQYDLLKCGPQDAFVNYFLTHYKEDIRIYFPEFQAATEAQNLIYMVFCNGNPAGILVGKAAGDGIMEASMEYTTPTYRDCSVGRYLYEALPGEGVRTLLVPTASSLHEPYLEKMGYVRQEQCFIKNL